MMAAPARKESFTLVLLILVVVMGCEIAYLIYQNRRLQSALAVVPSRQVLQQGQTLSPLNATDLDGTAVTVRYGEGEPSTVLIWFSPSCHICAGNATFWNDLYDRFKDSPRLRFLVMSDTGAAATRAYVAAHGLDMPVACVTDDATIAAYNGRVLPQTAFILPDGTIARVWPGALERTRRDEITTLLGSFANNPDAISKGGDSQ